MNDSTLKLLKRYLFLFLAFISLTIIFIGVVKVYVFNHPFWNVIDDLLIEFLGGLIAALTSFLLLKYDLYPKEKHENNTDNNFVFPQEQLKNEFDSFKNSLLELINSEIKTSNTTLGSIKVYTGTPNIIYGVLKQYLQKLEIEFVFKGFSGSQFFNNPNVSSTFDSNTLSSKIQKFVIIFTDPASKSYQINQNENFKTKEKHEDAVLRAKMVSKKVGRINPDIFPKIKKIKEDVNLMNFIKIDDVYFLRVRDPEYKQEITLLVEKDSAPSYIWAMLDTYKNFIINESVEIA